MHCLLVSVSCLLLQLMTHPDKNQGVIGALEASQRINAVCVRRDLGAAVDP